MCDRAPAGMEYTLQSTGRNGYLTVFVSRALMWAICTAGLRVAFLTNKDALTMIILYSVFPRAISANEGLLRTRRNLTSTPLIRNLSCINISTWRRPIMSTTRLLDGCCRRDTNPRLGAAPAASWTASMRSDVSLHHS